MRCCNKMREITFAEQFREYKITDIKKDVDWNQAFEASGHCNVEYQDKNAILNFFYDALELKYQLLVEVDDFIYIPIVEKTYHGESIKKIMSKI